MGTGSWEVACRRCGFRGRDGDLPQYHLGRTVVAAIGGSRFPVSVRPAGGSAAVRSSVAHRTVRSRHSDVLCFVCQVVQRSAKLHGAVDLRTNIAWHTVEFLSAGQPAVDGPDSGCWTIL